MSKLQRQEDEMYQVAYTIEVPRLCQTCNHHHGQIYGGIELVCAVHPCGYSGDSCSDYQAKKKGTSRTSYGRPPQLIQIDKRAPYTRNGRT